MSWSPVLGSSPRWAATSRPAGATSSPRKSGAGRITRFDPEDYACKIACEVKPADHAYGFDPGKRVDHKVQRQVDPFIVYGIDAAGQAIEDAGLTEMSEERALPRRRLDRLGDRRPAGHRIRIPRAPRARPAPGLAALRPRPADQPDLGPGLDQIRPDGPQPCRRHRLLDRRPFDRRRRADDRDGRCRRHARRRRRSGDLPDRHCRLRPGAGAVDRLQRPARARQPAL